MPLFFLDTRKMGNDNFIQQATQHLLNRRSLMIESLVKGGLTEAEAIHAIDKGIPQSKLFMAELIPIIHRLYESTPARVWKSALDIGPHVFGGTQLLAETHAKDTYSALKLKISVIDLSPKYQLLASLMIPDVEIIIGDIFDMEARSWDFIIASHVIEHVPEPKSFANKLQESARDFVLFAAPWNETPITTPGHVNIIDKKLTGKLGARDLNIFTNYSWGKDREVCTFWLPGLAK